MANSQLVVESLNVLNIGNFTVTLDFSVKGTIKATESFELELYDCNYPTLLVPGQQETDIPAYYYSGEEPALEIPFAKPTVYPTEC